MSVKVGLVGAVIAAQITLELPVSTVIVEVFVEVSFLGRRKGTHVTFEGTNVTVSHDMTFEVTAVHGDVVTVSALAGFLRGTVLGHVSQELLECRRCYPAPPTHQPRHVLHCRCLAGLLFLARLFSRR